MTTKILIVSAGVAMFSVPVISILAILDLIGFSSLWESVERMILIVVVIMAASVLIAALARLAGQK